MPQPGALLPSSWHDFCLISGRFAWLQKCADNRAAFDLPLSNPTAVTQESPNGERQRRHEDGDGQRGQVR
jgi:hypothetical protein